MSETTARPTTPVRRVSGQNLSERGRAQAQRRFLDELESTANVAGACRAARISRTIAYAWRAQDPVFAAAWEDALNNALDDLEQEAFRRAREGSDQLVMFLLKAHRPDKYRDVVSHQTSGETTLRIVFTNDWRGVDSHRAGERDQEAQEEDAGGSDLDLAESVGKMLGHAATRDADGVSFTYRAGR